MLNELFNAIISMSMLSCIAIIVILILRAAIYKRVSSKISYFVWIIIFIKLIIPVTIQSDFSIYNFTDKSSIPRSSFEIVIPNIIDLSKRGTLEDWVIEKSANQRLEQSSPVQTPPPRVNFLGLVWGTVALLLVLIFLSIYIYEKRRLRKLLRYDTKINSKNILISDRISSPLVMGIFSPQILIPEFLIRDEKMLDHIIKHEEAHIKRNDHIKKPLALFVACLHWFNPFVWIALFLLLRDMEDSCDEIVLSKYSNEQRTEYAKALCDIAQRQNTVVTVSGICFGESAVKSRIKKVLEYKKTKLSGLFISVSIFAISFSILLTSPANAIDMKFYEKTDNFHLYVVDQGVTKKEAMNIFDRINNFGDSLEITHSSLYLDLENDKIVLNIHSKGNSAYEIHQDFKANKLSLIQKGSMASDVFLLAEKEATKIPSKDEIFDKYMRLTYRGIVLSDELYAEIINNGQLYPSLGGDGVNISYYITSDDKTTICFRLYLESEKKFILITENYETGIMRIEKFDLNKSWQGFSQNPIGEDYFEIPLNKNADIKDYEKIREIIK